MSLMTKKALAASLKQLMQRNSLEKITVKEVVEGCGVNRQTFYYHFQDIYDLLGWIFKSEAVDSIADYRSYDTWQQGFLKIFEYVENNRDFCLNTLHSLGRDHLELFLHQTTFDLLMGVVCEVAGDQKAPESIHVPPEDFQFIANFYTFAFIGLFIQWMTHSMREEPKAIIRKITILIEGDIEKALRKFEKEPSGH